MRTPSMVLALAMTLTACSGQRSTSPKEAVSDNAAVSGGVSVERAAYDATFSSREAYSDAAERRLSACFGLPGVEGSGTLDKSPHIYPAIVTGRDEMMAFEACLAAQPDVVFERGEAPPADG